MPDTQELLINGSFSAAGRDARPVRPTVPGATEVLPGWWLLPGNSGTSRSTLTAQRGYVRLSGDTGTRLVQTLSAPVSAARLTARVRVVAGVVDTAPVFEQQPASSDRLVALSSADGTSEWQTVDRRAETVIDQVTFCCAADNTVADIETVSLSILASSPSVVSQRSSSSGTTAGSLQTRAATVTRPADTNIGTGTGTGGGGGATNNQSLLNLSVVAPGGTGVEPGAQFPVTVTVEKTARVIGVTVTVTCNGNTYPAVLQPGTSSYVATVRAYVYGSISITADASGSVFGSAPPTTVSQHYPNSSQATLYMPVTLTNLVPTLNVSVPTSVSLLDSGSTPVPITVKTADTGQFGPRTVSVGGPNGATLSQVDATTFQGSFPASYSQLGDVNRTVFVNCIDFPAQYGEQVIHFAANDVTAPRITVLYPHADVPTAVAALTDPIHVVGTAFDDQSGVASVSWSFDANDSNPTPATLTSSATPATPSTWTADVTVSEYTAITLYLWAKDVSGNPVAAAPPTSIEMDVRQAPRAATLADRLGEGWYLFDLLNFAADGADGCIVTAAGSDTHPTFAQLTTLLAQPLDRIALPQAELATSTAEATINELRVPVEVLRSHLATNKSTATTTKADHLNTAYNALLGGLGTSYTEIRLARSAASQDRLALAARLGINLTGAVSGNSRPDQLDQLILDQGSTLTEQALQDLFGLASTQRSDPLQPVPAGSVLTWQQATARANWQSQDAASNRPVGYVAVLDPDLIGPTEVLSSPMHDKLTARAQTLATFASQLENDYTTATRGAGLAALLAAGLPTGTDLAKLQAAQIAGQDITAQLSSAGLDQSGFVYLRQLQVLASDATVELLDSERDDAVDVLVAAARRLAVAGWHAEEVSLGYVFGPETLALTQAPSVGSYRAQPAARADLERTLTARAAQFGTLTTAAATRVSAAEQSALPVLRDALLVDLAALGADDGDSLTRRYELDILAGGTLNTTRLRVALASLQALYADIRDGTVAHGSPAQTWQVTGGFEQAWQNVMSSYAQWRSAMTTYYLPETALDPTGFPTTALTTAPTGSPTTESYQALIRTLGTGAAADDAAFEDAVSGWQQAVANFLSGHAMILNQNPTFTYAPRDETNRATLAGYSATLAVSTTATDLPIARQVFWAAPLLIAGMLQREQHYVTALDWYDLVLPVLGPAGRKSIYSVVDTELAQNPLPTPDLTENVWAADIDPFDLTATVGERPAPHVRAALTGIISCLRAYADSEFTTETDESLNRARQLYLQAEDLITHPALAPVQPTPDTEPRLTVPQLDIEKTAVRTGLSKLRAGCNIDGSPITVTTDDTQMLFQVTPYPYKTLLARAQQLASQAQQIEGQYQSALAGLDSENLALTNARAALGIANAQILVHQDELAAANDGVNLAQTQLTKSQAAVSTLTDAVAAPPNDYEQNMLSGYSNIRDLQNGIAGADAAIGIAQAAGSFNVANTVLSLGVDDAAIAVQLAGYAVRAGLQVAVNNAQAGLQANQLMASYEDRRQQWQIQLAGAQQDVFTSQAQLTVAHAQVTTANDDLTVATLQASAAGDTLNALNTANLSAAVYAWLVDTLGEVYRYLLQRATATARLAQTQLSFERATSITPFIRADYTRPPGDLLAAAKSASNQISLAGAALLTEDLAALDDYAFSTDRRRLDISQTFSLASMFPADFVAFRDSGELSVSLPQRYFDYDFPGDYLRLIRQARVSVVALVPPTRGVRLRLSNTGISRVIAPAPSGFTELVLRRDPQTVNITSPVSASGVFDTDQQATLQLPFEGSGVDTSWQISLPRAANPFDYTSIADVLLTIDYTALTDNDYRSTVITALNADRTRTGDAVISLAGDCPDQWYALCNPDDPTAARSTNLTIGRSLFPINLDGFLTTAVTVQLHTPASASLAVGDIGLQHGPHGGSAPTSPAGMAGSRRGAPWIDNGGAYDPLGTWTLTLDPTLGGLLDTGQVDDILLDLTWTATAPAWPT